MIRLLSPSTSARGPPGSASPEPDEPINAPAWAPTAERNVIDETNKTQDPRRTVEVRCPKEQCGCSPRGKLLATLIDVPVTLFGSGAVLQVACPSKKSRLLRIRL